MLWRWFQSHNGAIAAWRIYIGDANCASFNPTMVRLLRATRRCRLGRGDLFQSHNGAIAACTALATISDRCPVSIPQWCDCCVYQVVSQFVRQIGFNPTMVRLLRSMGGESGVWCISFQSHNGAIAAQSRQQNAQPPLWFQSHNGAIAACETPVRDARRRTVFQSHNGAIAAQVR